MNRGQAIARIQEKLGFATNLSSNIASALQDVQVELEGEQYLPIFLKTSQNLSTTIGQRAVHAPSNFIREDPDQALSYVDSNQEYHTLIKDITSFLNSSFGTLTEGPPQAYSLLHSPSFPNTGFAFGMFPLPDAVYTVACFYYGNDTTLSSDSIENKWLKYAHDLMIGMAGKRIAEAKRDKDAIAFFTNLEAQGRRRLNYSGIAQEVENRVYRMGGED